MHSHIIVLTQDELLLACVIIILYCIAVLCCCPYCFYLLRRKKKKKTQKDRMQHSSIGGRTQLRVYRHHQTRSISNHNPENTCEGQNEQHNGNTFQNLMVQMQNKMFHKHNGGINGQTNGQELIENSCKTTRKQARGQRQDPNRKQTVADGAYCHVNPDTKGDASMSTWYELDLCQS